MMDDATLHYMIEDEKEHFERLEKRRARAILMNESRDVLAHYNNMQSMSLRVYNQLVSEKYRRENEMGRR